MLYDRQIYCGPYCTVLCCAVLYCPALSCPVLFCPTVLYCPILYYTILYYTILYYTVRTVCGARVGRCSRMHPRQPQRRPELKALRDVVAGKHVARIRSTRIAVCAGILVAAWCYCRALFLFLFNQVIDSQGASFFACC